MITIYCEDRPVDQVPYFLWRKGEGYLCTLKDVQIHLAGRSLWTATPIYNVTFLLEKHPGFKALLFGVLGALVNIQFARRWPWVQIHLMKDDTE